MTPRIHKWTPSGHGQRESLLLLFDCFLLLFWYPPAVNTPRNNRGYSNASTNSGPLFNYLQNYHFNVSLPTQKKNTRCVTRIIEVWPGSQAGWGLNMLPWTWKSWQNGVGITPFSPSLPPFFRLCMLKSPLSPNKNRGFFDKLRPAAEFVILRQVLCCLIIGEAQPPYNRAVLQMKKLSALVLRSEYIIKKFFLIINIPSVIRKAFLFSLIFQWQKYF